MLQECCRNARKFVGTLGTLQERQEICRNARNFVTAIGSCRNAVGTMQEQCRNARIAVGMLQECCVNARNAVGALGTLQGRCRNAMNAVGTLQDCQECCRNALHYVFHNTNLKNEQFNQAKIRFKKLNTQIFILFYDTLMFVRKYS